MNVLGIDLKANNIILVMVKKYEDENIFIENNIKKITLQNDESQDEIKELFAYIKNFVTSNKIEKIALKKRSKKGNFAGGAVTFKIESMIQLLNIEVQLISSVKISSFEKKNSVIFPKKLNKYQEQAYLCSLCLK